MHTAIKDLHEFAICRLCSSDYEEFLELLVDLWHDYSDTIPLHEFLDMSFEEYMEWI